MKGGKDDKPKNKRPRTSDGDKPDKAKRGMKAVKGDKGQQRSRRPGAPAGARDEGIAGGDGHTGPVAAGDKSAILDEEGSEELKEADADRAFIDDEGEQGPPQKRASAPCTRPLP